MVSREKRYGWGWGLPTTWEGWVVFVAFIVLLVLAAVAFPPRTKRPAFLACVFVLGGLLLRDLLHSSRANRHIGVGAPENWHPPPVCANVQRMPTPLLQIVSYLDGELKPAEIPDYSHALNGLQLANRGLVSHVAAAVDFSLVSIREAIHRGADLLLLHHGMFWGGTGPITGAQYERLLSLLFEHDVAVYGSHIPLDVHPVFGNNALLAKQLGLDGHRRLLRHDHIHVGLSGSSHVGRRRPWPRRSVGWRMRMRVRSGPRRSSPGA